MSPVGGGGGGATITSLAAAARRDLRRSGATPSLLLARALANLQNTCARRVELKFGSPTNGLRARARVKQVAPRNTHCISYASVRNHLPARLMHVFILIVVVVVVVGKVLICSDLFCMSLVCTLQQY